MSCNAQRSLIKKVHVKTIVYDICTPCQKGQEKMVQLNEFGISFHLIIILLRVFNSLVQPNVVLGNCNNGLSEKLQKIQNHAAGTLVSASYDNNLDNLFRH